MGQSSSEEQMQITIQAGDTQSQELFDYNSLENRLLTNTALSNNSYLIHDGDDIYYQTESQHQSQVLQRKRKRLNNEFSDNYNGQMNVFRIGLDYEKIELRWMKMGTSDNHFGLSLRNSRSRIQNRSNGNINVKRKALWKVLGMQQKYPLKRGDIIKIGKLKLRFKELITQVQCQQEQKELTQKEDVMSVSIYNHNHNNYQRINQFQRNSLMLNNDNSKDIYHQYDMNSSKYSESRSLAQNNNRDNQNRKQCRICFQCNDKKQNPLINLCKCLGSVKYIHFECLKDWRNNNSLKRQHNNTLFYSYPEAKCELCKQTYPLSFFHLNKRYRLLDLSNAPKPPYAIFEELELSENEENKRFSILLIGMSQQEEITLGRNSNCNVLMKDISVSRNHCSLFYMDIGGRKKVLIKDNGSKFGTLVKIETEVEFSPRVGLSMQYQSKVIRLKSLETGCCCCAEKDSYKLVLTEGEYKLQGNMRQNNQQMEKDIDIYKDRQQGQGEIVQADNMELSNYY